MAQRSLQTLTIVMILLVGIAGSVSAQEQSSTVHIVQPGENLFRIALNYGVPLTELAAANSISDTTRIFAGQNLIIPGIGAAPVVIAESNPNDVVEVAAAETVAPAATEPIYHTVQRGDNLRAIAQRYNISEAELIALNNLTNPNRILTGQALLVGNAPVTVAAPAIVTEPQVVAAAPAAPAAAAEPATHVVQAGETLASIASRYGVATSQLIASNNITNPDRVLAGQTLIIPAGGVSAITVSDPGAGAAPPARIGAGREIVVDLSSSRVYAYENGMLMYEAISSNGLPATPTVQGNFTVQSKVRSQTMSGPSYWLPNVEWVLYFYQGYALHGAYWHDNFGQPMSHGCVNLTNEDARWFYDFAQIGTPVTVQT